MPRRNASKLNTPSRESPQRMLTSRKPSGLPWTTIKQLLQIDAFRQAVGSNKQPLLGFAHVLDPRTAVLGGQRAGHRLDAQLREGFAETGGDVIGRCDEAATIPSMANGRGSPSLQFESNFRFHCYRTPINQSVTSINQCGGITAHTIKKRVC
jgi:hypothetical protein